MHPIRDQKQANRFLEGGVFYPVGHILLGFEAGCGTGDALDEACEALTQGGVPPDHVTRFDAASMEHEAGENLKSTGLMSVGASLPAREMQLELAKDGCEFLLIYAPSDEDQAKVIELLRGQPLRYAVKYHRLVIEDLLTKLDSSAEKKERARVP